MIKILALLLEIVARVVCGESRCGGADTISQKIGDKEDRRYGRVLPLMRSVLCSLRRKAGA